MLHTEEDLALGSSVTFEFVDDDHLLEVCQPLSLREQRKSEASMKAMKLTTAGHQGRW
jgi:hypothetical protein